MQRIITSAIVLTFSLSSLYAASDAEALAEAKCTPCHIIFAMSKEKLANMKAPPFWAIAKKVKQTYPNRLEGIAFVKAYALAPSKEKMIFPVNTYNHFGLMPSQKGKLSDAQLQTIAEFMLDKQ